MEQYLIYTLGLSAQVLFSSRLIIQWFQSEKAGKVLSPTIFWQLSLIASILLIGYGILQNDLAIILGQFLSYFIYIRNLQYKNVWKELPRLFRYGVLIYPFLTIMWLSGATHHNWNSILFNASISGFMMGWGILGQGIFTCRFIYQWYYSEKLGQSVLPVGFWIISIIGSIMIIIYGMYRLDLVIILGQVFGVLLYGRNIILGLKYKEISEVV